MTRTLHCCQRDPVSRVCQAGHYADRLVQELFSLEFLSGIRTLGMNRSKGFRVQEETMTESMLLKLEASFPDVVAVETYTRKKEGPIGADWFWIFDFRGTLVPVLVQAKKIEDPWDGTDVWRIRIDGRQRLKLLKAAQDWKVGSHLCLYAPCLVPRHSPAGLRCSPFRPPAHIHLLDAAPRRSRSVDHNSICHEMLPFTCWCCCSGSADDAASVLGVSRETFREGDYELRQLLDRARDAVTIKGSVVLTMKGELRG